MTSEKDAPAEMPGVEEIARALCISEGKDPDFNYDPLGLGRPAGTDLRWRCYEKSARAILALFAPILAEKEREIAVWQSHHASANGQRNRAEAALVTAGEDAITAYASHLDVAMREYDDNLHYGDDALGPEHFIEQGMDRAAAAIRAQIAAPGAAMEAP